MHSSVRFHNPTNQAVSNYGKREDESVDRKKSWNGRQSVVDIVCLVTGWRNVRMVWGVVFVCYVNQTCHIPVSILGRTFDEYLFYVSSSLCALATILSPTPYEGNIADVVTLNIFTSMYMWIMNEFVDKPIRTKRQNYEVTFTVKKPIIYAQLK